MLVILSIIALFMGPFICQSIQQRKGWFSLLDAFIFVTISGLVLFHILPEALYHGGLVSFVFVALGLFGPGLVEKYFHGIANQAHNYTLLFGVGGLVLHAVTDGGALVVDESHTAWLLALGVILHRLPVGLTVWWLLRPQYGRMLPIAVLTAMSLATLAGSYFGSQVIPHMSNEWLAWFQALVTGSILHVVFHRPYQDKNKAMDEVLEKRMAGLGTLFGLLCLAAVLLPHWLGYVAHNHVHMDSIWDRAQMWQGESLSGHGHETALALQRFISLALHSSPALLLAYAITYLLNYLRMPARWLTQLNRHPGSTDSIKGAFLGLSVPICVPDAARMYQNLQAQGSSQIFALSFLIAAPILSFDALLLSWPLLGSQWVMLRLVLALLLILIIGVLVGRWLQKQEDMSHSQAVMEVNQAQGSRLLGAIKHSYEHLIDHTAPWIIVGWIVAATLAPTPGWQMFAEHLWLQILLVIVLALPMHLCATGLTPVAAVLLLMGVSPGAVLALLLVGPTINLSLFSFIEKLQGKRVAITLFGSIAAFAFMAGWVLNQYAEVTVLPWLEHDHSWAQDWLEYISLAVICVLFAVSLFKRGARAFLAELIPASLLKKHQHEHAHHHEHHHH
ncbi:MULTISPECIES: permease [unclassified Motilimonas]|uniref:permease n=1 Tax=unclassified Motilimonas TaxID=2643697 RepID=UPI001E42A386|nr:MULTISPECIES: permease [unclassified Motilimonas]MCE0557262.1 permease [Motilimonas sp. E26]MDO6526141.1 permease [Motilimonas sp. 1_MG-2023]